MAAASPWTHDQVTAAFRRMPELEPLLLKDVVDTGERLGEGAFGVVLKLRVARATLCAGKTIHGTLTSKDNQGAKDVVFNFLKECKMMADLRHPNIVQFMGVCLLQGFDTPILVMELLTDCLHNFLLTHANVPIGMRQSLLTDVASALVFMHSRDPQIIHRDLTAKNVLVDERSMKAKVADLGNSRLTQKSTASLTRVPGTLVYMPPEAFEPNPNYCEKLDIFSFGHLGLFTLTQVFPENILAPNFNTEKDEKLTSRTEVDRRKPYFDLLHGPLSGDHPLVELIKMCLANVQKKRPSAMQVLQRLEDMNPDYEYVQQRFSMVEMLNQKDQEIKHLRRRLQQKESELELSGDIEVVMSGPLQKFSPKNIMRKWKSYTFKVTDTHLRFFNTWTKKPRGEIPLSAVSCVLIPHRSGRLQGDKYCFEVHFNGKESPWILSAYSVVEQKRWMEAICGQRPKQTLMEANTAYGVVTPTVGMNTPDTPTATEKLHEYESIAPLLTDQSPPAVEKPTLPYRPPDLKRSPAKSAATKSGATGEENRQKGKQSLESQAQRKELTSPNYEKTFATLNRRANNFTSKQISHLIAMLQQTQDAVGSTKGDDEKKEASGKEPSVTIEDKDKSSDTPPTSTTVLPYYVNYDKLLEHEKLSEADKEATFPRSGTKSPYYVNYLDVCERGRPSSVKNRGDSDRGPRPRSASPTSRDSHYFNFSVLMGGLSGENSQSQLDLRDKGTHNGRGLLKPPVSPKPFIPSPYLEPIPSTPGKQQETLKHILKQSKQAPESLLITEDDTPEEYVTRPQWAKANTKRPGPKTLAAMNRRGVYIEPRILTKVVSLGEGRFGNVYKAEMMRMRGANVKVAIKSLDQITPELQREVTIMSEVVHPNIVRLHGLINEGEMKPAVVMEYLSNGDLKTFLSRNTRSTPQLMKYMIDVAMGMHYLFEKGIIHRDLAARNILVDKNELCKVADFGLMREVPPRQSMLFVSHSGRPSPIRWMAPESICKRVFSPASDIWSFGILQWEMFNPNKLYPYPTLRSEEVVEKVTSGYPMPTPRKAPQIVVRIMKACWNSEPSRRPSFLLIANLLTSHMIGDD